MTENAVWTGGQVAENIRCVLAPNPSPMTLEGTNTWIWGRVGWDSCVVVDPGPDISEHRDAILRYCHGLAPKVSAILLTHDHADHSAGASALSQATGAPVLGARNNTATEGELTLISPNGPRLYIALLPGHTADSIGIIFPDEKVIATGDTIFAYGSAMIDWPDGSLRDYLSSLNRLKAIIAERGLTRIIPGHGAVITNPLDQIADYYGHRMMRLSQVREVMDESVDDIIRHIFGDIEPGLYRAAWSTIQTQLEYLRETRDNQ